MPSGTCSVDGCGREKYRREWCNRHYLKWRKYGDPARPNPSRTEDERFWEKVDKMGPIPSHVPHLGRCWVWIASLTGPGYGQIWWRGRRVDAHRASWELHNRAPLDGMWVLHHCDNPACVNPDHLFLGTNSDNIIDCVNKGRFGKRGGEHHPFSLLTEQQASEIRRRFAQGGVTYGELGEEFGVSYQVVGDIIRGRTYREAA